jgi:vancomycin permeability regulator SanA
MATPASSEPAAKSMALRLFIILRRLLKLAAVLAGLWLAAVGLNVVFAMTYPVDRDVPEAPRIVILSHTTGQISNRRVDVGVALFERVGATAFIPSGDRIAALMAQRAEAGGIPPELIQIENVARSTLQNAILVREMIDDPDHPTILVTERFHLLRSYWSFRWAGFRNVILIPSDQTADYANLRSIRLFSVEGLKWGYNLLRAGIASLPGVPTSSYPWLLE